MIDRTPPGLDQVSEEKQNIIRGLATRPRPILDSQHQLMLFWSAKAGCTFAVKWMLDHMGLLQEALAHHQWVHKFRVAKLYAGLAHKSSVRDFLDSFDGYRAIKIARNPYKRAVSSYIHAARFGYEDARISDFLSRPVEKHGGFSFREFVTYLETIDLCACNVHHRVQVHPLERYFVSGSRFVIDLDHSWLCFRSWNACSACRRVTQLTTVNHPTICVHHRMPTKSSAVMWSCLLYTSD